MRNTINTISVIKDITSAIEHHSQLVNYYTSVVPFEGDWRNSNFLRTWSDVDLHVVNQGWGSTSCGWGGIGGAAMSSKHNVIIEKSREKILFVYWDGQLAYILDNKDGGFKFDRLPMRGEKIENIIYLPKI